jgi:hypothetical protein
MVRDIVGQTTFLLTSLLKQWKNANLLHQT